MDNPFTSVITVVQEFLAHLKKPMFRHFDRYKIAETINNIHPSKEVLNAVKPNKTENDRSSPNQVPLINFPFDTGHFVFIFNFPEDIISYRALP